jgi:alpha-D-ribose 1-methylphosphonate 5-triphosphate diphosphatase
VSEEKSRPVLQTVLVNGNVVCQMNYQMPLTVGGRV